MLDIQSGPGAILDWIQGFLTTATESITPTIPATAVATTDSIMTPRKIRPDVCTEAAADADFAHAVPHGDHGNVQHPDRAQQQDQPAMPPTASWTVAKGSPWLA